MVDAAEELELAVRPPAGEVADAIEAPAGGGGEGIGAEALGGQLGPAEVAARDAAAADPYLTRDA